MLGFSGSHRTGKTTLARAYAERNKLPLVLTSASKVFADLGADPKADYPFAERMRIQREILRAFKQQWIEAGPAFVSDRTPIDLLAYTLADIQRNTLDAEGCALYEEYRNECIATVNRYFGIVVVIQPGIAIVEDATKAPGNAGYVDHIASLVLGITVDERISCRHFYVPRHLVSLNKRVEMIESAIKRSMDNHRDATQGVIIH